MKVYLVSYITKNKAVHKAVRAMDSKTTIQHNKLIQLENSMLMYGIYNAETLENSLTLCTIYTTQHLYMRDYLQDSKAH